MAIDSLEEIQAGDSTQWIRVRGADASRGLLASLVRSPDYSPADVLRTVRGITATQAALLPELASMDLARTLPRLEVPVVMVQGRHDQVAPGAEPGAGPRRPGRAVCRAGGCGPGTERRRPVPAHRNPSCGCGRAVA
jgi:pimeloyl-ACP methyl ester carboxylesterase